jgi:hypothetical protein
MPDDDLDETTTADKNPCTHPGCSCPDFVSKPGPGGSSLVCFCDHLAKEHGLNI